jgi:hypothetical protein
MQKSKVSNEDIARQLNGINRILESIAEETSAETKAVIEQAKEMLVRIAIRLGNTLITNSPDYTVFTSGTTPVLFDGTHITTRIFDINDFENIEVDCAFIFEVVAGKTYNVAITANESLFDIINVTRSGDTLRLSLKPVHFHERPILEARITMPVLKRIRQSAATRGVISGFRTKEPFDLFLSGASSIDLDIESGDARLEISGASSISGKLKATKTDILLSGASHANLKGQCNNLVLSAWGAAELDLSEFHSETGIIYLKGASQATVQVDKRLDIDLTGASRLEYLGNPDLSEVTLSGASVLNQYTPS